MIDCDFAAYLLDTLSRARPVTTHTSADIQVLLDDIHACRLCPSVVSSKVARSVLSNWNVKLVLMAQAPSEHGIRVSGVHWVDSKGKLRPPGGTFLEGYLRRVGFSINPDESRMPRPYTTNVLQCWPGPGTRRDRPPSSTELANCNRWWQTEFALLRPKAVLLLGKPAADAFIATCHRQDTFSALLESQDIIAEYSGGKVGVFTVPHPTAPYKGPRGGRSEYYEIAFTALKSFLASASVNRRA